MIAPSASSITLRISAILLPKLLYFRLCFFLLFSFPRSPLPLTLSLPQETHPIKSFDFHPSGDFAVLVCFLFSNLDVLSVAFVYPEIHICGE